MLCAVSLFSFLFRVPSQKPIPERCPQRPQPEASFVVHVSETDICCTHPDGRVERVAWDDLQAVIVQTTADGPALSDVFWILAGTSEASGCVIPQGATGETAMLERLQKLPGLDNETLILSMSSTEDQKFLCWQRHDSPG